MTSDETHDRGGPPADGPDSDHGIGDATAAGDSGGAPVDPDAVGGTGRAGAQSGVPVGDHEDVPGGRVVGPDSHMTESEADTEAGGSERPAPRQPHED